jgi:hypothetical protein
LALDEVLADIARDSPAGAARVLQQAPHAAEFFGVDMTSVVN